MLARLGIVVLLIVAYIVVTALELATNVVAPILVIGIALVLFIPFKKQDKKNQ